MKSFYLSWLLLSAFVCGCGSVYNQESFFTENKNNASREITLNELEELREGKPRLFSVSESIDIARRLGKDKKDIFLLFHTWKQILSKHKISTFRKPFFEEMGSFYRPGSGSKNSRLEYKEAWKAERVKGGVVVHFYAADIVESGYDITVNIFKERADGEVYEERWRGIDRILKEKQKSFPPRSLFISDAEVLIMKDRVIQNFESTSFDELKVVSEDVYRWLSINGKIESSFFVSSKETIGQGMGKHLSEKVVFNFAFRNLLYKVGRILPIPHRSGEDNYYHAIDVGEVEILSDKSLILDVFGTNIHGHWKIFIPAHDIQTAFQQCILRVLSERLGGTATKHLKPKYSLLTDLANRIVKFGQKTAPYPTKMTLSLFMLQTFVDPQSRTTNAGVSQLAREMEQAKVDGRVFTLNDDLVFEGERWLIPQQNFMMSEMPTVDFKAAFEQTQALRTFYAKHVEIRTALIR